MRVTTRVVAAGVFLLLVAGALVTSTGSGLAVPDWPLSYGKLMPPMVGGIRWEHGHRVIAAAVSTLVGLQMVLLFFHEKRKTVRRLGVLAFAAILAQAVLGGLTVIFLLPPAVSSAHAALAEIVFALTAAIALMCSKAWTSGSLFEGVSSSDALLLRPAFTATVFATGAIYLQILLGAVVRHTGAGLAIPDFPTSFGRLFPALSDFALPGVALHFAHRLGAAVVLVLVLVAARRLGRAAAVNPLLGTFAAAWTGLVSIQVLLGALSILSRKAVPLTVAHLAVGALCWVLGVVCAMTLGRTRSPGLDAISSRAVPDASAVRPSRRIADFAALTKPRITLYVVMTAFVGFVAGTTGPLSSIPPVLLLHTLLGTALVASGTSAFNQLREIDLDGRMKRTAGRPLPAGRLSPRDAFLFASALSVAGILELTLFVNVLTAGLAAFTLLSYVLVYTPMKTVSPLSTIVGAVPGALPPLGGFTAAHGAVAAPGLALFALLFLWQLPHFFAIGWRHREDYGRAGVRILSTTDPTGRTTARHALVYCLALLPVSLLPTWLGTAGRAYAVGAFALTLLFFLTTLRFARETTDERARSLFLASIGWLPAVLLLLVLDRV